MTKSGKSILNQDLKSIHRQARSVWTELNNSRIFITGGTGFFGRWLLHSLKHAVETDCLNIDVTILSRTPLRYSVDEPQLWSFPAFTFLKGDISNFEFPDGKFTYVIHGAADSSDHVLRTDPITMCKSIVNGVQRVLEFAVQADASKTLFLSSGAVFGGQHPDYDEIPDNWTGHPLDCSDLNNAYAEAKRFSEMFCTLYREQHNLNVVIARCFSFIGPYLPLNANYAVGNFISNAMSGGAIIVNGAGTEQRSYLYTADLAVWLWTILVRSESGSIINVGSDKTYSILEVAQKVADVFAVTDVLVRGIPNKKKSASRYVPSIVRAREMYGLDTTIDLTEAIRRTAIWYGWRPSDSRI